MSKTQGKSDNHAVGFLTKKPSLSRMLKAHMCPTRNSTPCRARRRRRAGCFQIRVLNQEVATVLLFDRQNRADHLFDGLVLLEAELVDLVAPGCSSGAVSGSRLRKLSQTPPGTDAESRSGCAALCGHHVQSESSRRWRRPAEGHGVPDEVPAA